MHIVKSVVLLGNFSYPNSNWEKKFYPYFTPILRLLPIYQGKQDFLGWICINTCSYPNTFLRRWGGCLAFPNAVGDRWGLTTPLCKIWICMSLFSNSVNCHLPVQLYTREYNRVVTVRLFIHALANERRNHYGCGMHFYLSLACRIIISDPVPRGKSEA